MKQLIPTTLYIPNFNRGDRVPSAEVGQHSFLPWCCYFGKTLRQVDQFSTNFRSIRDSSPHNFMNFIYGGIAGVTGRICTNNMLQTCSNYQQGFRKIDLSLSSTRAVLVGSKLQMASVHFLRGITENEYDDNDQRRMLMSAICNSFSGLLMHPSNVRFYLRDTFPDSIREKNSFVQLKYLLDKNPAVFKRGLGTRVLMSALDWTVYFEAQREFERRGADGSTSLYASLIAVLAIGPLLPSYVQNIKSISPDVSNISPRNVVGGSRVASFGIFALSVLDRCIVNMSYRALISNDQ